MKHFTEGTLNPSSNHGPLCTINDSSAFSIDASFHDIGDAESLTGYVLLYDALSLFRKEEMLPRSVGFRT